VSWKEISKSKGYKSLKEAYTKGLSDSFRGKKELYDNFQWIINRAKHYAHYNNVSLEQVLSEWEEKRTYGILNYYQDCRQPKHHEKILKRMGLKGRIKNIKNDKWYNKDDASIAIKRAIKQERKKNLKDKPRWSMERKKRGY